MEDPGGRLARDEDWTQWASARATVGPTGLHQCLVLAICRAAMR